MMATSLLPFGEMKRSQSGVASNILSDQEDTGCLQASTRTTPLPLDFPPIYTISTFCELVYP